MFRRLGLAALLVAVAVAVGAAGLGGLRGPAAARAAAASPTSAPTPSASALFALPSSELLQPPTPVAPTASVFPPPPRPSLPSPSSPPVATIVPAASPPPRSSPPSLPPSGTSRAPQLVASPPAAPAAPAASATPTPVPPVDPAAWRQAEALFRQALAANDVDRMLDAIRRVGAFDCAESARCLLRTFTAEDQRLFYASGEVLARLRSPGARQVLAETLPRLKGMFQAYLARILLVRDDAPARTAFLKLAAGTVEPRTALVLADGFGYWRVREAVPILLGWLERPQSRFPLRVATLRALARIPAEESVPRLLSFYRRATGRSRREAWVALRMLTGREFACDEPSLWENWWREQERAADPGLRFHVDAAAQAARDLFDSDRGEPDELAYFGIPLHGRRLVFLLDHSGSMDGAPMESARAELTRLINQLPPDAYFNIVAFGNTVQLWSTQPALVQAGPQAKQQALGYIRGLRCRGQTQTNTPEALRTALVQLAEQADIEELCLLSDGQPELDGHRLDPRQILAETFEWNYWTRARIHTVAIVKHRPEGADEAREFLRVLAEIGGGCAVDDVSPPTLAPRATARPPPPPPGPRLATGGPSALIDRILSGNRQPARATPLASPTAPPSATPDAPTPTPLMGL